MAKWSSIGLMKESGKTNLFMLQTVVWPAVSSVATRRGYWFQQDGARPHTTRMVLDWLAQKIGEHVISNLTDRVWLPRSPDLSPLDFWLWGVCLAELRRSPPGSIEELKETVNAYADSLIPMKSKKLFVTYCQEQRPVCLQMVVHLSTNLRSIKGILSSENPST